MTDKETNQAHSILLILGGGMIGYEIGLFTLTEATGADFVLLVVAILMIIGIFAKQAQNETN